MEEASAYVVAAGVEATFEALWNTARALRLAVVEEDARHRRLAFRLDGHREDGQIKALCAILDVGHGLSKLVVVCRDEADGSIVAPADSLTDFLMHVEHTLHTTPREEQRRSALPSLPAG